MNEKKSDNIFTGFLKVVGILLLALGIIAGIIFLILTGGRLLWKLIEFAWN